MTTWKIDLIAALQNLGLLYYPDERDLTDSSGWYVYIENGIITAGRYASCDVHTYGSLQRATFLQQYRIPQPAVATEVISVLRQYFPISIFREDSLHQQLNIILSSESLRQQTQTQLREAFYAQPPQKAHEQLS